MVTTIGWVNIILLLVMSSMYLIKQIYMHKYKKVGKERAKNLGKLYQFSRKAHPVTGIIILILGVYHGSQAYGLTILHTGTILLYSIFLMAVVALAGPRVKSFRKHWKVVHRTIGILEKYHLMFLNCMIKIPDTEYLV